MLWGALRALHVLSVLYVCVCVCCVLCAVYCVLCAVCVCVCVYMCVCMCVYMCVYLCMCMCMCVCVRLLRPLARVRPRVLGCSACAACTECPVCVCAVCVCTFCPDPPAAGKVVGAARCGAPHLTMTSEDFSYFLHQRPGCFFFVGSNPGGDVPHHKSNFTFREEAMLVSASIFVNIVEDVLMA